MRYFESSAAGKLQVGVATLRLLINDSCPLHKATAPHLGFP